MELKCVYWKFIGQFDERMLFFKTKRVITNFLLLSQIFYSIQLWLTTKKKKNALETLAFGSLNPIKGGVFLHWSWRGSGGGGEWQRSLLSKICHPHPTMIKHGIVIPYLKKIQNYMNNVTHLRKSAIFVISNNIDIEFFIYI